MQENKPISEIRCSEEMLGVSPSTKANVTYAMGKASGTDAAIGLMGRFLLNTGTGRASGSGHLVSKDTSGSGICDE